MQQNCKYVTYYAVSTISSQEENKILDKMHRQKVAEVEKLTQTVRELEEAVLAGGAAANAVRDYQRKVQEMNVKCQCFHKFNPAVASCQIIMFPLIDSISIFDELFGIFRKKGKHLTGSWPVPR